ncbi:MAG: diguanylate cyclase [Rhodocyclaceae bacterium]|nr:diguanylate cyclase [Rhodocyclaceae bacterium]
MDARRLANSLVVRLIAFGVFMVLAGLVGRLFLLSGTLRDGMAEVLAAQQRSLATYVAADIDGKILARRHLLETIARELPLTLLKQPEKLEAWLSQHHATAPLFSNGVAVVPYSGKGVIADTPHEETRHQLDFLSSDWFLDARDKSAFAIGKPSIGRVSQRGIIIMATPILDPQGRVVAVLHGATALDAPGFLDLIQNNSIGETGGYLLISPRDKLFVAASMEKMRLQPTPAPGLNRLHDKAMTGWRGSGITVNAFGIEEMVAFASVPAADWFVVARLPTAEAFEPVQQMKSLILRNSLWLTAFIILVLVFYLTYTFRPLEEAARQMRRMADGNARLEPLPVKRNDEVGEMVEGFNYLLEKLRESDARMAHLAHHDALTGLPNRLSFLSRIQQNTALAKRQGAMLALMFIDLDRFKPVNDLYGHEAGDELLRQVAERLGRNVRQSDTLARFGGDEFVLVLNNVVSRESAAAVAAKLIAGLSEAFSIGGIDIEVGASIGIALYPDDADDIDALIAQADAAMYDAKRSGRNCCRFAHKPD